ncbi:hypothetical protein [Methanobacterium sp.]|uniref:hypothetical protein n=1 Tax=Methanobacterium sp. TaxID=2164 RepID=UPI003C714A74
MKQKILIVGILLIMGMFLASPVSAATLVDKNTHNVYSTKFNCYGSMTYTTYKISTYHYRTYIYVKYKNGKDGKVQIDLTKPSYNKIKMTVLQRTDWGNSYNTKYIYTSWSVYKFYFSYFKYVLRSMTS